MRKKVHVFDSYFYSKYLNNTHCPYDYNDRLQKVTRKIELFSLDFILIPINYNLHWSLCVVVRPIEWMLQLYPSAVTHDDNNNTQAQAHNNKACLLFVDSLFGIHQSTDIQKRVKQFLSDEWNYKLDLVFSGSSIITPDPSTATRSLTTYTEMELFVFRQRIRSCHQYIMDCRDGKCLFSDISSVVCHQAPQQLNGYDCGIFCYKFAEVILNVFPTSLQSDLDSGFSEFFNARTFTQADATEEREYYRIMLEQLRETYIASRISKEHPSSSFTSKAACSPSSVVYVQTTKQHSDKAVDKALIAGIDEPMPPQRDKAILLECTNNISFSEEASHCFIYFEMQYHHCTGNKCVSVHSFQSGSITPSKAHLHIGVSLQNNISASSLYDLKVRPILLKFLLVLNYIYLFHIGNLSTFGYV
jgi:hypothetical protein